MDKCNLIGIVDMDKMTLITSTRVENTNDTPKFQGTLREMKGMLDRWHLTPGYKVARLEIREIERRYFGGWEIISERKFIS